MKRFFSNPTAILLIVLMLGMSIINGRFSNPLEWLISTLLTFPGIFIGLSIHEYAHAKVADMLGDNTPRLQGRVTLNPFKHIDPIGLISLVFIGFGWGKPVEVNPANFKNPRRDNIMVDLAGITMNFIMAILFMGVKFLLIYYAGDFVYTTNPGAIIDVILEYIVWINLVLMVFNLLPVPPLDGFGVVTEVFNLRTKSFYYQLYNMGFPILMVLIIFNVPSRVISPIISFLYDFIQGIFF